jgi:hypothetical protein
MPFQFSLKALILLGAVSCAGLGIYRYSLVHQRVGNLVSSVMDGSDHVSTGSAFFAVYDNSELDDAIQLVKRVNACDTAASSLLSRTITGITKPQVRRSVYAMQRLRPFAQPKTVARIDAFISQAQTPDFEWHEIVKQRRRQIATLCARSIAAQPLPITKKAANCESYLRQAYEHHAD